MHARLETNVLRDWRPGWKAGIAHNIATASDVQSRRSRRHSRRAWRALFRILAALAVLSLLFFLT